MGDKAVTKGENSYSHHADSDIGVAVVDRYSHFVLSHLEAMNKTSSANLQDFVNAYSYDVCHSNPGARSDLMSRSMNQVLMTDFFGGVSSVELASLPTQIDEQRTDIGNPEAEWKMVTSKSSSTSHPIASTPLSLIDKLEKWRKHSLSGFILLAFTFAAHAWAAHSN